jgi:hypothetical protein
VKKVLKMYQLTTRRTGIYFSFSLSKDNETARRKLPGMLGCVLIAEIAINIVMPAKAGIQSLL